MCKVINGNKYCDGTEPELNGLLSHGNVSFTSDDYTGGAGFSMIIQYKGKIILFFNLRKLFNLVDE